MAGAKNRMDLAVALFEKGFAEERIEVALKTCKTMDEAVAWLNTNAPAQKRKQTDRIWKANPAKRRSLGTDSKARISEVATPIKSGEAPAFSPDHGSKAETRGFKVPVITTPDGKCKFDNCDDCGLKDNTSDMHSNEIRGRLCRNGCIMSAITHTLANKDKDLSVFTLKHLRSEIEKRLGLAPGSLDTERRRIALLARAEILHLRQLARASETMPELADPFGPILRVIDEADEYPESCRDMLRQMAPHCLRVEKQERQSCQTTILTELEQLMQTVVKAQRSAVEEVEARVETAEVEKLSGQALLTVAEEELARRKAEQTKMEAKLQDATTELTEARKAFEVAKEGSAAVGKNRDQAIAEKAAHDKFLIETWGPVQANEIQDGTLREQMIEKTILELKRIGIDDSLEAALPPSLKVKPSERGRVSAIAVEGADEVLVGHVKHLVSKIESFDENESAQKVAAAKEHLENISTQLDERSKDFSEAADAVLVAKREETEKRAALDALEPALKKITDEINAARAKLQHTGEVVVKFQKLNDR